jgi:hypothetical protein
MAAFALAVTLVTSGLALAQRDHDRDDDDGYYRQGNTAQARQYGYQNGYRDGVQKGRHEGRERDPYDYRTPDWRQAARGYKGWMGPVNWYERGYQEGYSNGFRSGYQETSHRWGDGDRDRDDGRPYGGRGAYDPNRIGYGGNTAYRFGVEDGSTAAREDIEHRKPYNSKPRGRFEDRDHGYRREYGSRDRYRAEYTDGYRAGYDSVMGHRY